MPGTAQTSKFQFSMATVMLGPQASLLSLNPAANSIGLVKNFMIDASPKVVELGQGITNDLVASFVNDMQIKVSMEAYEHTAANLAYAMSLDGTAVVSRVAPIALQAPVVAGATTLVMVGDQTTAFIAGGFGYVQEGNDDIAHEYKIVSAVFATGNTTVTFTGYPVPAGMNFSIARGRAGTLNKLNNDASLTGIIYLSAKVRGLTSDTRVPVTLWFPKIKILKGFSLKFTNSAIPNLPIEFSLYTPLVSDAAYSPDWNQRFHYTTV